MLSNTQTPDNQNLNILHIKNVHSLADALKIAYGQPDYGFRSSPWFIDIKDSFRIFIYKGATYIAKRRQRDDALEEVKKSRLVAERIDNAIVESKRLRIITPEIVSANQDYAYIVSEYAGIDLNELSYLGANPMGSASQYIHIMKFMIENGVTHPGFLPRNIVEKGNSIYLFDWEDAELIEPGESANFDRLWYTNFVLNWSYLFPREELDRYIREILNPPSRLVEPSLVGYEKTFKEMTGLTTKNPKALRDSIERAVFSAELPIISSHDTTHLRPNDLGHLFADIFFKEMDVMCDIATSALRLSNENLYGVINHTLSHIVRLYRNNNIENLHYSMTLGALLLVVPYDYTEKEYLEITQYTTLEDITSLLSRNGRDSIVSAFIEGVLDADRLGMQLKECIEKATTHTPPPSTALDRIVSYIIDMQKETTT